MPGEIVQIRYRISLHGAVALGFSAVNYQPTFDGWDTVGSGSSIDRLLPFADVGSNTTTPIGGVTDESGAFGRILPFAAPNITTTNRLRGHFEGTRLRIAQNTITNPIGVGTSSNNINGAGGIPTTQSVGFFEMPPTYSGGTKNVLILKLGVVISDDPLLATRVIDCSAPLGAFSMYGPVGNQVRAANWHTGYNPTVGVPTFNYAPIEVVGARIQVVPAPAAAALLGLYGIASIRRRKSIC